MCRRAVCEGGLVCGSVMCVGLLCLQEGCVCVCRRAVCVGRVFCVGGLCVWCTKDVFRSRVCRKECCVYMSAMCVK